MNIIFIGFMGSGKSTVGKLLAQRQLREHIEMDDLILHRSGRSSISEIFAKDGEIRFRELEMEIAKEVSKKENSVISSGGGVVMNKINIDYLKMGGFVVCLKTSFRELEKRLKGDMTRPLFQNKEKARELYDVRSVLYETYADHVIKTDHRSIVEVVTSVINIQL